MTFERDVWKHCLICAGALLSPSSGISQQPSSRQLQGSDVQQIPDVLLSPTAVVGEVRVRNRFAFVGGHIDHDPWLAWKQVADRFPRFIRTSELILAFHECGETQRAAGLLSQSVKDARQLQNTSDRAWMLSRLAASAVRCDRRDIAIKLLESASVAAQKIDSDRGRACWLERIGLGLARLGADRQAAKTLTLSLDAADKISEAVDRLDAISRVSVSIAEHTDDTQRAAGLLKTAIESTTWSNRFTPRLSYQFKSGVLLRSGQALAAFGEEELAAQCREKALDLITEMPKDSATDPMPHAVVNLVPREEEINRLPDLPPLDLDVPTLPGLDLPGLPEGEQPTGDIPDAEHQTPATPEPSTPEPSTPEPSKPESSKPEPPKPGSSNSVPPGVGRLEATISPAYAADNPAERQSRPIEIRSDNGLEMKLVACPPGQYLLGTERSQPKHMPDEIWSQIRRTDEEPVLERRADRLITLTRSFWIGQTEVTRGQWDAVMGKPDSSTAREPDDRGDQDTLTLPITRVSWSDAADYCARLTKLEREAGRLPEGLVYRLPTEAEWEYACRAGTNTFFHFGNREADLSQYDWCSGSFAEGVEPSVQPVATKRPNPWQLYDMHGNVSEWCLDHGSKKQPVGTDPVHDLGLADTTTWRVARGGSFTTSESRCGSGSQHGYFMGSDDYGFRVVLGHVVDPTAATPEDFASVAAILNQAQQRFQRKEYRAFCETLSPEGIDQTAAGLVLVSGLLRFGLRQQEAVGNSEAGARNRTYVDQITQLLEKHGYPRGNPPQFTMHVMIGGNADDERNDDSIADLLRPIKDKAGFISDAFTSLNNILTQLGNESQRRRFTPKSLSEGSKLVRLSVVGDSAMGNVQTAEGEVVKRAISAQRVEGRWKLQIEEIFKTQSGMTR